MVFHQLSLPTADRSQTTLQPAQGRRFPYSVQMLCIIYIQTSSHVVLGNIRRKTRQQSKPRCHPAALNQARYGVEGAQSRHAANEDVLTV